MIHNLWIEKKWAHLLSNKVWTLFRNQSYKKCSNKRTSISVILLTKNLFEKESTAIRFWKMTLEIRLWQSLIILRRYMKKIDAFLDLHFSYDSNLKLTLRAPIIIDWKLFSYLSNNFVLRYLIGFYQAISDNFRMLLQVFDKEIWNIIY